MKKSEVVYKILHERWGQDPKNVSAKAFAPTNIALCKYWGKRNQELNLPMTSSLSISLGHKGANVELTINEVGDAITLNNKSIDLSSGFGQRLIHFLNLFRSHNKPYLEINIESNIPIAAGLASSACGFASLILALDKLYDWQLEPKTLSILARLGSGSASRSIWQGFVEWHVGIQEDGMDSYAELLPFDWSELCVGLLIIDTQEKKLSSREAMQRTIETSALYSAWPQKVSHDLSLLKKALAAQDFQLLGETAESNAMTMHATMLSAWPSVTYFLPETILSMQKVWQMRKEGIPVYFTQDAGPNLKLLFLQRDAESIRPYFSQLEIICHLFNK